MVSRVAKSVDSAEEQLLKHCNGHARRLNAETMVLPRPNMTEVIPRHVNLTVSGHGKFPPYHHLACGSSLGACLPVELVLCPQFSIYFPGLRLLLGHHCNGHGFRSGCRYGVPLTKIRPCFTYCPSTSIHPSLTRYQIPSFCKEVAIDRNLQ